jgi:triosephosphate isomerase
MTRTQIAAANWKMNLNLQEAISLAETLVQQVGSLPDHHQVLMAVPFPYLLEVKKITDAHPRMHVAAQNLASTPNGAFTGEVSAEMLQSINIKHILIGHSERREYYHESHDILRMKVDRALMHGLQPVFCCGEPLSVREANEQDAWVEQQLRESLFHLSADQITGFILAYEPIWAIGTGKTASSEQAQAMHHHIRKVMSNQYGEAVASTISILYGGSVKANNASELFSKPDVDGGLVGGASLVAAEFTAIIHALKS